MNGNTLQESRSPLSLIDTSFDRYVKMRQASAQEHMDGGVPDYSFALDEQMRKRVSLLAQEYPKKPDNED